jgi:hypothetical protein
MWPPVSVIRWVCNILRPQRAATLKGGPIGFGKLFREKAVGIVRELEARGRGGRPGFWFVIGIGTRESATLGRAVGERVIMDTRQQATPGSSSSVPDFAVWAHVTAGPREAHAARDCVVPRGSSLETRPARGLRTPPALPRGARFGSTAAAGRRRGVMARAMTLSGSWSDEADRPEGRLCVTRPWNQAAEPPLWRPVAPCGGTRPRGGKCGVSAAGWPEQKSGCDFAV